MQINTTKWWKLDFCYHAEQVIYLWSYMWALCLFYHLDARSYPHRLYPQTVTHQLAQAPWPQGTTEYPQLVSPEPLVGQPKLRSQTKRNKVLSFYGCVKKKKFSLSRWSFSKCSKDSLSSCSSWSSIRFCLGFFFNPFYCSNEVSSSQACVTTFFFFPPKVQASPTFLLKVCLRLIFRLPRQKYRLPCHSSPKVRVACLPFI